MTYTPQIITEPKAKQTISAKLKYYHNYMIPIMNMPDLFNPPQINLLVAVYLASYNQSEHYYITTDQVVAHRVNQFELMAKRLLALHPELTDSCPIILYSRYEGKPIPHEVLRQLIDWLLWYNKKLKDKDITLENIINHLEKAGY